MTNLPMNNIDLVLEEKLQTYRDFLTYTLLLKGALENEEMSKVARLLEDRWKLAGKVDRLDQQISQYEQAEIFAPLPADSRRQTENVTVMAKILKCIVVANKDCGALATSKCAELKSNLIMMREKEKGLHGYAVKSQRLPVFLSVKT